MKRDIFRACLKTVTKNSFGVDIYKLEEHVLREMMSNNKSDSK